MKSRAFQRGYLAGYTSKEAGAPSAVVGTGLAAAGGSLALIKAILPWVAIVPPVAGAGLGMMQSKLEAPTMLDQENLQGSLESAELDEAIADLERNKARAKLQEKKRANQIKAGKGEQERSLHI